MNRWKNWATAIACVLLIAGAAIAETVTVANVAALATARPGDGDVVVTLGKTTVGDGGTRTYRYDADSAATADGFNVVDGPGSVGRYVSLDQETVGVQVVNVLQYGADPTGVADSTEEIQAAIDAAAAQTNRPIVYLPPGKYLTTATITIEDDYIALIGGAMPSLYRGDDSGDTTRGATIRYTGTGTALLIGVAPGTNGTFIKGTRVENLRIETDDDSAIGMRVWHSSHGRFSNIVIFGMTGNTNIGLNVQAGIDNIYEQIEISGIGQSLEDTYTDMAICLKADLGYSNEQATTTTFRRCYFHYGCYGAFLNYTYDFEDCVFEACDRGVEAISNFSSTFTRCWFEANVTWDIYFDESSAILSGCKINSYARETFFATGTGIDKLSMRDCTLSTTDLSPVLFAAANNITSASGTVLLSGNTFPASMTLGGSGYTRSAYDIVSNSDMRLVIYRFVAASVAASTTLNPMLTEGGLAAYRMPAEGHVVGLHVYGSSALSAGNWDIAVKKNGTAIGDFSYPTIGFQSSSEANFKKQHYTNFIAEGDDISVYFHTDGSVSPTMDYTVEVVVALGDDGMP